MHVAETFVPQSRKPLSYYAKFSPIRNTHVPVQDTIPSNLLTIPVITVPASSRPIPLFTIPSTPRGIPKRSEIKPVKRSWSSWRKRIPSPTFKTVVIWSISFLMLNFGVTFLSSLLKETKDEVSLQYIWSMREELKNELYENQQEFKNEHELLKAKLKAHYKLMEYFNEQVLNQHIEHEQLRQELHQIHKDFIDTVNEKMKQFNERVLNKPNKFKLMSELESEWPENIQSRSMETTEKEENVQ